MNKKRVMLLASIVLATTIQAQDLTLIGKTEKTNVTELNSTDQKPNIEIIQVEELDVISSEKLEEEKINKKWSLDVGASYKDRQQGRINSLGYKNQMPDDAEEGGDLADVFIKIKYQFTDDWAFEYDYGYLYSLNQEATGYGKNLDGSKAVKDNGFQISNTIWLKKSFNEIYFLDRKWKPRSSVGYRNYSQSAYNDSINNDLMNGGYDSNRFLFNLGAYTKLTKKDGLDVNFEYQYRDYDYNDDTNSYQHRNYLTVNYDHDFNDQWEFDFRNVLYVRYYSGGGSNNGRNNGEWDYNYSLNYNKELKYKVIYSPYLTTWGELALWDNKDKASYNQSEINFYPLMFKYTFEVKDVGVSPFVGAGYTQGYDTQSFNTMYAGFESIVGVTMSSKF